MIFLFLLYHRNIYTYISGQLRIVKLLNCRNIRKSLGNCMKGMHAYKIINSCRQPSSNEKKIVYLQYVDKIQAINLKSINVTFINQNVIEISLPRNQIQAC